MRAEKYLMALLCSTILVYPTCSLAQPSPGWEPSRSPDDIPVSEVESPPPGPALAQESPDGGMAQAIPPVDAPPVLQAAAGPDAGPPTAGQIAADGVGVAGAAAHYLDAVPGAAKRKALMLLIATVLTLLISIGRRYLPLLLHGTVVALICALVGVAIGVLSHLGVGLPMWQAFDLALAGPGAMVIHELRKLPSPKQWVRSREKAMLRPA